MKSVTIGLATLYHGDCREAIKEIENIAAVVSDPPYGIEDIVGGYSRSGATIKNDKNLDCCFEALGMAAAKYEDLRMMTFYSCRITDQFFARASAMPMTYIGEIIWDKKAPGMGNPIRYSHENVAIFERGKPTLMGETFSIIVDMRAPTLHPHQKPPTLMQSLVKVANVVGGTILDPFMGSGSTGVAAVTLGKKFVGCELDDKYFKVACDRIAEAQKQEGLF